ncbi:fanconi anemia group a protein [Plakobranchus ocellatus]|uniref:Fanconi anemia group a protein n=1 Tax=Plakobranchus ocellatus TaxID=259542 RepID=A0AAV4BXH5_9GAST|nr:fanconi anemia group a protein [Plakobranchus ocellatus]
MLSEADKDVLMDAAYQIIDSSVDSNALFHEACALSRKLKQKKEGAVSEILPTSKDGSSDIERFLSATCDSCALPSGGEVNGCLTTPNLGRQIVELSQADAKQDMTLLAKQSRDRLQICVGLIKISLKNNKLNKEMFLNSLLKHDLPLEVIWTLHQISAIELGVFLTSKLKREGAYKVKLCEALVALCVGLPETRSLRQHILSDFTAYFMRKSFADKKTSTDQVERQIIDTVLKDVLDISVSSTEEDHIALPCNFLSMTKAMEGFIVKKFAIHALSLILSHGANKTVEDCMKSETDWASLKSSCSLRLVMKELFLPLSYQEVTGILNNALEHQFINGTHIHEYLSALFTCFSEATAGVKEHIQSLISSALEKSNIAEMFVPFFLACLSSSLGPHCFPCFADWFQITFCGPTSAISSRSGYNMLIKFLTSLIPWESAERLKAYIFHRPVRPPKCKEQYEDLAILAKTKLMDLGVPLHETMSSMYGDCGEGSSIQTKKATPADSAEQDVQRAVASFTETRKIPTVLVQASIFQRPYFLGKFLPALLKPRVLPDPADERMLLIAELNKSGKIPGSTYNHYVQECEREKQALLEGVFDVDDEDEMQELTLPLIEQLNKRLEKFVEAVLTRTFESNPGCLTAVIEKVSSLLIETPHACSEQLKKIQNDIVAVDLYNFRHIATDTVFQIVELLSDHVSSLVANWQKQARAVQKQKEALPVTLISPVMKLLRTLLQRCPELRTCLYSSVLTALKQMKVGRVDIGSPGLPLLCVSLSCLPYNLSVTLEPGQDRDSGVTNFTKTLLDCLDILNGGEDVLRFCLSYVQVACCHLTSLHQHLEQEDVIELDSPDLTTEDDLLPPTLVKKVHLMCCRRGLMGTSLCQPSPPSNKNILEDLASSVFADKFWNCVCEKHEISLVEWVELEWMVDSSRDILSLSERWAYLCDTSGFYLEHSCSLSMFCKTVILTLARLCSDLPRTESAGVTSVHKATCFLQLLQKLLLKLPPSDGKQTAWLLDVLQSSENTNHLTSFATQLPAHLLFCDSLLEDLDAKQISTATAVIEYFVAFENIVCGNPTLATSRLDPVVMQPIVFTSFLVHKPVLTRLKVLEGRSLSSLAQTSSFLSTKCQEKLTAAEEWVERLEANLSSCGSVRDSHDLADWQIAAALFSHILQRTLTTSPDKVKLSFSVCVCLLEMLAANLTLNAAWPDFETAPYQSVAEIFVELLSRNPGVLKPLLSAEEPQLRTELGATFEPWMPPLRNLFILRLARKVPARVILQSREDNLILPVVSAYSKILSYAQESETSKFEGFQPDLSLWIKSLIDLASPEHLASIPDYLSSPHQHDVLLFRYILEKKRARRF